MRKNIIIKLLKKQYKINNIENINGILDKAIKACKDPQIWLLTQKDKANWDIEKRMKLLKCYGKYV